MAAERPLEVRDMSPKCCEVWGVPVRKDRPCLFLRGLLSAEECEHQLTTTCQLHEKEARSLEIGERSEFSHTDECLSEQLWLRLKPHIPESLDEGIAIGLRTEWHHARYFPGQAVFAHMDQRQTSQEHRLDPCIASRITLNIYLDDGYEGGAFVFVKEVRDDGTWGVSHTILHPERGDAVLFYQATPEFSHGVPPLESGIKTIMRSDVMYRFKSEEQADVGGVRTGL